MNNIYKVIWSKAKNCYVVASEIAKSHTKSASGSEKMGGYGKRALLALAAASAIFCGGLVNVGASVQSETISAGTTSNRVLTVDNTDDAAQLNKVISVVREDKLVTKDNIGGQLTDYAKASDLSAKADANDVYSKTAAEDKFATKTELESYATRTELDAKANTNLSNLTEEGKTAIKTTMADELAKKADAANVYTKDKVDEKLDLKANEEQVSASLNEKADKTALTQATDRITVNEKAITGLTKTTTDQQTAIDDLKKKTAEISHEDGEGTKISGVTIKDGNIVGNGNSAITQLANVGTLSINGKNLEGAMVATEKEVADAVKAETDARKEADNQLEEKITKNSRDIATLDGSGVKYDSDVKDKITLKGPDGTKITHLKDATLSDVSTDAVTGRQLNQTNKDLKTEAQTREDMDTLLSDRADALEKNTGGITRNDAKDETYIEKNVTVDNQGSITANGKVTAKGGVDAGAGAITTTGAVNAGSLNVENASHLKGKVIMDNKLSVTGDTSLKKTDVDGALTVTGASDLKGDVILGTTAANTVTVNGKSDFKEAVEMDNGLTVTNGETNLKNTNVEGNLKVTGTITTDKMVFGDPATNNYTEIDHGKVTSKNLEVRAGGTISSLSTFDVEKNEVSFNSTTGDQSYHKQTSDVIMDNVKDGKNSNNRTQTKTETKDIITDENGNSSTTSQTASQNKTYLTDKDRKNSNSTIDTATGYDKTIKGENGKTSTKQDELNITNTAKDGTITNDAKDIVNNATTMKTTVTGKATESYGELETTVNGQATENYKNGQETTVTGDKKTTVTGKTTEEYKGGLETTVTGDEKHTVTGNQTTNVTGDILNTAKNITNEANETLTDKVGTNTRVTTSTSIIDTVGTTTNRKIEDGKITDTAGDSTVVTENGKGTTFTKTGSAEYSTEAGATKDTNIAGNRITTGRVDANELGVSDVDGDNTANLTVQAGEDGGVKASASNGTTTGSLDVTAKEVGSSVKDDASGKGSTFKQRIDAIMGNVKTVAGESEVTQTGDEITSKVGLGEATNSRVTQKKNLLEAAVTDGTNYNISNDTANESAKELRGGTKVNRQYDNLNGSQKTIADGANTNLSIDTASASAKVLTGGTKVNKLQDNLDSSEKTITNGVYTTSKLQTALDITNTAKDGTITNDAKNIVNNATGDMTNTVGGKLTTTVTGQATENFKGGLDTNVTGTENHTVTGDQNIYVTGNQTTTVTGDISNKAENITNEANTKLTDKVGDNTRVLDSEGITDTVPGAGGKGSTFKQRIDAIMGNVKTDAGESEVTQKGDEITSVVGKGEATNSRVTQKKGSLEAGVTDGTNTNASYDVADASAKVLTGGTKVNKLQDNLDSSEKTITNGVYTTSKLQTALDITNTAKDGTITNDAKNIVNNATGDMTNTVGGKLTTTVTGQATENFKGGLKTDITGEEIHTVTGNQTNKVTGKQTNTVEGGQENIISGGQINNITGDQTTTISGTQTTTARDINRNASSGMIDTIDNAYGTNTETKVAGKTTTDVSIKGTGEKGQYIRGANESRDYLIKGTLKNSETKTAEATSTEITDGNGKTSSTIQDVTQISGSVTDGTNTSVSNVKANSIDSAVTDGSSISTINQKKNSITSQVTDGTTITKTEQDTKNITNTAKDGTITNDAKDIVNNASGNMTNTVGGDLTTTVSGNELHEVTGKQTNKIDGDQENTIGGNQTTTVTGDISNKAENITNEANTKLTDKVGENTRVLDSEGITDTVGGSTFKQRIDKIMMESKDVSIKAEETLTNEAKVITNKASEVINNEAVNINNTATGIITSKASEIKNQADKLISNKVGENTWENMENGKITTSIKDGAKQNLTQSDAAGTTQSTVDGGKSTVTIQNADGLADAVTDGTNTSVQNQTASAIAAAVRDGAGNENASVANATTSVNTIKSGSKANTVISTADGTSFINSEAAAPVGDGTEVKTTIKGNTITTGKVTMDYAEVMKDLGVRGNANITGKTTTGSLEVTGTSTLKGDVTMGSNATVKKDLTVEGNTNLKNTKVDGTLDVTQKATFGDSVSIAKDLSVDGNATIKGDVTAKSYKVGDKTYISAAGINANDQKITNVADGSISEGSKDAVNGGQLYTVKNDLEGKVNKVGANAAAMANLHPMEFDPDSKWNIAAAIGNYGSETAAALGAFYRPNDDVMVNLSTAFGTGENMVGGGVSVRLGKSGNKLSREENNALKDQVNDLTARMDALLSVLNPNMSKDFPDVPENHWAYEAVSRLAGNDIVQGYPDGEFHGERTMTRYEMAEIIYNALSRGAEAEKELVEEFKPELQAMAASEKATAERAEG